MLTKLLILYQSAEYKFKGTMNHKWSQIISRDFIMDADFIDRSDHHSWSLSRVTGRNLDPRKHWYVATKGLCGVRNLYVVSAFSLCAALLRQREFPTDGFMNSQEMIPVVDAVNRIALECDMPDSSFGGKSDELQKCQSRMPSLKMRCVN